MLLSPLGERLGEGVTRETIFALTPLPNLSPKGERNMNHERHGVARSQQKQNSCSSPPLGERSREVTFALG